MQVIEPVRVERSYIQNLRGKPQEIFPLLCPVREKEWVEGWDPLTVYTRSGFAEKDCVFTTGEDKPDSIWMITDFDTERYRLEIVKFSPGMTVARITITLLENGMGQTDAEVVYRYTAVSPDGEEFVKGYSEEFFEQFMQFSESALNSFLDEQHLKEGRA